MEFTHTGLILRTENYAACVEFYRDKIGLPVAFAEDHGDWALTSFGFGEAYLLLETGGVANQPRKSVAQSPVKLRMNVADVQAASEELRNRGVHVVLSKYDWGTIAEFTDPDGNICALRSEDGQHRVKHA